MAEERVTIQIRVRDREKTAFDGPALALTSVNDRGVFDILPNHANFISLIRNYLKIRQPDGKIVEIKISGQAVLRVVKNQAAIFMGIGSSGNI